MPKFIRDEMLWDAETHELAERAAFASGLTEVSAYITQLVRQHAPTQLEAHNAITLTNAQFDAFCEACDNPLTISAKLRSAANALDGKL